MGWLRRRGAFIIINVLALLPLLWLAADAWQGRLSADPVTEVQDRTGLTAIALLTVSLAGTPLYRLLGFGWLRQVRRLAGLYAVGYAALHLLNLVWLDYGFNLTFLYEDVLVKRYIIAGLAAFILLLPLVVISAAGLWERGWRRLRYLVYPAALLAAVHFVWQAKIDTRLPLVFAAVIALLLFVRLPFMKKLLDRPGRRRKESA
jgi:methionine sulfoxide reductase heme-binding subunit